MNQQGAKSNQKGYFIKSRCVFDEIRKIEIEDEHPNVKKEGNKGEINKAAILSVQKR